jgi:hypothetical protein
MKEIISVDVLPDKDCIDVYGPLSEDAPPLQLRGTVRLQLSRPAKFKVLRYVKSTKIQRAICSNIHSSILSFALAQSQVQGLPPNIRKVSRDLCGRLVKRCSSRHMRNAGVVGQS